MLTEKPIWGPDAEEILNDKLNQMTDYAAEALEESPAGSFAEASRNGLTVTFKGGRIIQSDGTVLIVAEQEVDLADDTPDQVVVMDEDGVMSIAAPSLTLKPVRQCTTATGIITASVDIRVDFDFSGGASASVAWDDITGKPTTVAGSGLSDAATTDDVADEATARDAADTALQSDVDAAQADIDNHIAETAPHSGHFDIDGSKALTGDMDAGGNTITNVAAGVNPTDVPIMSQLDAVAAGYKDLTNAKAMSTTNLTLSGAQTIDSVSCVADDRVFLTGQTTQSENGLWVVQAGAWYRPLDFDTGDTPVAGSRVFVVNGTTYHGTSWSLLTSGAVIDTDPLEWTQTGAGGSGEVNTISNVGSGAVDIAKAKSGVDFPLRRPRAASTKQSVVQNGDNVDFDVVEANLNHANIGGTLPGTKGGTGFTTSTLGDLIVGAASNAWAKLAANSTGTRKYLMMASSVASWVGQIPGSDVETMGASGAGHKAGVVPDPGATAGSTRSLHEDGTWKVSAGGGYKATSVTSRSINTGSKFFTVQTGLAYSAGVRLRASYATDTTQWMEGLVTAYNGTTGALTIDVDKVNGSGTYAAWNINAAGEPGAPGADGADGADGAPGADGADGIFTAIASQAEAEAGTDNVAGMTALRTAQAITALGGGGSGTVDQYDIFLYGS